LHNVDKKQIKFLNFFFEDHPNRDDLCKQTPKNVGRILCTLLSLRDLCQARAVVTLS